MLANRLHRQMHISVKHCDHTEPKYKIRSSEFSSKFTEQYSKKIVRGGFGHIYIFIPTVVARLSFLQ